MLERSVYLRAAVPVVVEAALRGVWVAAGGLSTDRRRLLRGGAVAVAVGLAAERHRSEGSPRSAGAITRAWRPGSPPVGPPPPSASGAGDVRTGEGDSRWRVPTPDGEAGIDSVQLGKIVVMTVGAGMATHVTAKRLQRRWLQRLSSQGKAHPHLSLGVRVLLLQLAITLPARLKLVHDREHRRRELTAHAVTTEAQG